MIRLTYYVALIMAALYAVMTIAILFGVGEDPYNTFGTKLLVYLIIAYLAHREIEDAED